MSACGSDYVLSVVPPEQTEKEITGMDLDIAYNVLPSTPIENGVVHEYQRYLYEAIAKTPSLLSSYPEMSNFYATHAAGTMGDFQNIDGQIGSTLKFSEFFENGISVLLSEIKLLNDEIALLNKSLKYAILQEKAALEAALLNKVITQNNLGNELQLKMSQMHTASLNTYHALYSANNNLVVSEIYDVNQKNFNTIFLDILRSETNSVTSPQQMTLNNIAYQCCFIGGRAVLQARALKAVLGQFEDYTSYDESCSSAKTYETDLINKEQEALKIYPNPSNQIFNISVTPTTKDRKYQIYNSLGREIKEGALSAQHIGFNIDMIGEIPGVYYIRLKGSISDHLLGKLILLPKN